MKPDALTQAKIDKTDPSVRAAHHITFASAGYGYRGLRGRIRYLWGKYVKGVRTEYRSERLGNDRQGYRF